MSNWLLHFELLNCWLVKLVQSTCMRCHRTKCPLHIITLSFCQVTFLPEGVIARFWNFAWGLKSQKNNNIWLQWQRNLLMIFWIHNNAMNLGWINWIFWLKSNLQVLFSCYCLLLLILLWSHNSYLQTCKKSRPRDHRSINA